MTKEQLIELVRFTAGEIVAPTELSVEDAESIVDDFVDKEQLTIPVVVGRSEQLVCDECSGWGYIVDENGRRKAHCTKCD